MASRRCLRQKARISYYEPDEPDLDEYVYCEHCTDYVYEYCSIHGALLVIPDDKVPAKHNFPSFVPRAALTIPRVFLHLNYSSIPGAGLGVFATLTLPMGVRFGPYRGVKTKEVETTDYSWQIYDGSRRPSHVVDAADGDASNWMRFVNCARHWREQNLVAFQYRGELYYRTIKVVPRQSELLVFYGSQFANKLHIDLGRYNAPPTFAQKFGAPVARTRKTNNKNENTQVGKTAKSPVELKIVDQKMYTKPINTSDTTKPTYEELDQEVKQNNSPSENITTDIDKVIPYSEPNAKENVNANIQENSSESQKQENAKLIKSDIYFKCNECNYETVSKEILEKHLRFHDVRRQFVCEICSYRFNTYCLLNRHKLSHTTNSMKIIDDSMMAKKLYSCSKCDYKYSRAGNLKRHMRTHTGDKPYSCCKCDYKCSEAGNLKKHMRTHTGEKPYSCSKCDYKCSMAGNLKIHMRTHTGEKPYSCSKCDYKCSMAGSLKIHMRTHTGEKPYSCSNCDYKCSQAGDLKTHMRTHTGEKPYSCSKCDYKCSQAVHLKTHNMRIHTGEKPYSCGKCDYRCSFLHSLTS